MRIEDLKQYGVLGKTLDPGLNDLGISTRPRGEIASAVPGAFRSRTSGGAFVSSNRYPVDYRHGLHRLRSVSRVTGDQLAGVCNDPDLAFAELGRTVFLDTETTGLGMGVGTYVFLVGVGYLDGGEFCVDQFFLTGPEHEAGFLDELADCLSGFSTLVTFNGRAFDWPLLETRYLRHRRELPLRDPIHVDLLHASRRLWKRRLESCALTSLEYNILDVPRSQDDVSGYLIPQIYFRYQSTGEGDNLDRVFYHNRQDILSLASLFIHIAATVSDDSYHGVEHALDFYSLGRVHERTGDADRAADCYDLALQRSLPGAHRSECILRLAELSKRERNWQGAVGLWQMLVDEGGEMALVGRVELAKYFEHVERDYLQAIDQVQYALSTVDLYDVDCDEASRTKLEHRLARLLNRAMRAGDWVGARQ